MNLPEKFLNAFILRLKSMKKKNAAKAAFLRGEFMKKFYLLSNEVMSGGTSFDEFSISGNCVYLVS